MTEDLTKKEPVTEPVVPGRARRIVSLVVAGAACLGVAGSIAMVSVQGADASDAQTQTTQDAYVQPVTVISAAPTPASTSNTEGTAAEENLAGVDQWGVPLNNAHTEPASINYPTSMTEEELANARLWITQQLIAGQCMEEKGFDFTFKLAWERSKFDPGNALYRIGTPGAEALWGTNPTDSGPYVWENAGCSGYAVHVTGQDGND